MMKIKYLKVEVVPHHFPDSVRVRTTLKGSCETYSEEFGKFQSYPVEDVQMEQILPSNDFESYFERYLDQVKYSFKEFVKQNEPKSILR